MTNDCPFQRFSEKLTSVAGVFLSSIRWQPGQRERGEPGSTIVNFGEFDALQKDKCEKRKVHAPLENSV